MNDKLQDIILELDKNFLSLDYPLQVPRYDVKLPKALLTHDTKIGNVGRRLLNQVYLRTLESLQLN